MPVECVRLLWYLNIELVDFLTRAHRETMFGDVEANAICMNEQAVHAYAAVQVNVKNFIERAVESWTSGQHHCQL